MLIVQDDWIAENKKQMIETSGMIIIIEQPNGLTPFIPASRIIKLKSEESGSMLSASVPTSKLNVTFDNRDGYFGEIDGDTTKVARNNFLEVRPSFGSGAMRFSGFVSNFRYDEKAKTVTVECNNVLYFMKERFENSYTHPMPVNQICLDIIHQVSDNDAIPGRIEPVDPEHPTWKISIDFSAITNDPDNTDGLYFNVPDNATMADMLQLIANAARCVLVCHNSYITFVRLNEEPQDYTISRFLQYDAVKTEYNEAVRGLIYQAYDATTTITPRTQIGTEYTMTNNAFVGQSSTQGYLGLTADWAYTSLKNGRCTYSGTFRIDPRLELFDVINVQLANRTVKACIIDLQIEYNGGWKGTYKAVHVGTDAVITDINSLEGFAIEDLETFTARQLEDGQTYEAGITYTPNVIIAMQLTKTDCLDFDEITNNWKKIDAAVSWLGIRSDSS